MLLILGSCVSEIDAIGGRHDATAKAVGIFFFHLFLIFPCLTAVYVFLQLKLEKHYSSSARVERTNGTHEDCARKETSRIFGPLSRFSGADRIRKKNQ